MEEVVRPYGVKLIARLESLAGLALIGLGIGVVALRDIISKGTISLSELGPDGLLLYGYSSIGLGILAFLIALGVWSMSSKGRKMAIVCCVVGIFVPIFLAGLLGQMTFMFNLIVYPLIIYYLSMEDVCKGFT